MAAAAVPNDYGQVTLPVTTIQDKLVAVDLEGKSWVPVDSKIYYGYGATEPGTYTEDPNGKYALDTDITSLWFRKDERASANEYVWIKATVPTNANTIKDANAIVIHPFPEFGLDLCDVIYVVGGNEQHADLSYIPGWNGSVVSSLGKCRIWLPLSQVSEIKLKLKPKLAPADASSYYGLIHLSLQLIDFDVTGTLVTDFTNFDPGTIKSVAVYGKDQAALTYLGRTVSGKRVTVQLAQTSAYQSPVLTGIHVSW